MTGIGSSANLEQHASWLAQGDIFARVPLVTLYPESSSTGGGLVIEGPSAVPALLITHSCEMDKRTQGGRLKVPYLHFLPLHAVLAQDVNLQIRLRREELNPAGALFVGEVPEVGDSMVSLAEVSGVPISYFRPRLIRPESLPEDSNDMYLVADDNDSRIGTLEEPRRELLRAKLAAYWARIGPPKN